MKRCFFRASSVLTMAVSSPLVSSPLMTHFYPLSDILDLRHQSSAMCIILLGEEDTHPWSATNVGNPIPANIGKKYTLRSVPSLAMNPNFFPLSDIMDLRHQSSAMCIIMLGGEDRHPWSATKVGNPIPATVPVDQ